MNPVPRGITNPVAMVRHRAFQRVPSCLKQCRAIVPDVAKCATRAAALIMVSLCFVSCALQEKASHMDPFAAINPLQKFNPLAPTSPLAVSVVTQWEKDFAQPGFLDSSNGLWHTRLGRDQLVYRLILMCDYRFFRYEADLVSGKATRDTFIDLAVLGLSAASTFMAPGQATRVLSAISGGLVGSRATIEKNFYQNQAQPVLLRKMKVLRQRKLFAISHRLRKYGVDVYPTERALIDVLDYYNRGTMLAAIQELSNDTAAQEIELQGGKVEKPSLKSSIDDLPASRLPSGSGVHIGSKDHESITDLPPAREKEKIKDLPAARHTGDIPDLPAARKNSSSTRTPPATNSDTIESLPPARTKPSN